MNQFLKDLKETTNFALTENGAVTRRSTMNGLMDLFALGGAYRNRSEADCITLFSKAFDENPTYALKCLFYLRDVRGGQGERRFFRVVTRWLAINRTAEMRRNLEHVPEFGRWDDLYAFIGTPLEKAALHFMYRQLALDVESKTPSLMAKWLKSENASSPETRRLGTKTRQAFKMTSREYRKTLSILRERIRVVERLMSENRWGEIEFDKIPSKAGLKYRNAFARRDIIKAKYEAFAKNEKTEVNAGALYPHDVARQAFRSGRLSLESPERLMIQKYWNALPDYYQGRQENGIAVVDVSGSMSGTPMEAAVSMGAYIADKARGPFKNHFITFSGNPELVEFVGADITDKFNRCVRADWGMNTNLEAVFDLLLNTALKHNTSAEDMPERIYIFSDMEFDSCMCRGPAFGGHWTGRGNAYLGSGAEVETLMEGIAKKWRAHRYKLPSVIFWNLDARNNNIPAIGEGFSYVSGFSPVMIETILSGKDGLDLVLEKLNSERYACIG
ncbi:MAG: DUF2828 family protein [Muribaculaceae bacterium]|nr:DUF2828 family protein [Muribaculaceae bacterium]